MSERENSIDISGLDKAEVLAALFNASKQQGLGVLDISGVKNMSVEEARNLVVDSTYFDYLRGRVMKVNIGKDFLDPWGYDRDNGQGAAKKALSSLR